MAAIEYRNTRFRLIVALVASIYILLFGNSLDAIKRAFVTPQFYLAVALSFPMTLLLVYFVHRVTVKLDHNHDWRRNFFERLLWQFLFAVFLPCLIDLAFISIYSEVIGRHFNWTVFIQYDFPVIIIFLVLLNMYYGIHYLVLSEKKLKGGVTSGETMPIITINYDRVHAQLDVCNEILFLYRKGNLIKIVTNDHEYSTSGNLKDLEKEYSSYGLCRINRGTIINMRIVSRSESGIKPKTLEVFFNIDLDKTEFDPDMFTVTEAYIPAFREARNQRNLRQ